MVALESDAAPEDAAVLAVLVSRGNQETVGRQHADEDGYEELEVAIEVGEVEVNLVKLDRSYRLEHDCNYSEAADGRYLHCLG